MLLPTYWDFHLARHQNLFRNPCKCTVLCQERSAWKSKVSGKVNTISTSSRRVRRRTQKTGQSVSPWLLWSLGTWVAPFWKTFPGILRAKNKNHESGHSTASPGGSHSWLTWQSSVMKWLVCGWWDSSRVQHLKLSEHKMWYRGWLSRQWSGLKSESSPV